MSSLLHVFNRYLFYGGEENIIEMIDAQLARHHRIERCWFDSREWREPGAPSALGQAMRLFYNPASRARFDAAADAHRPDAAIFHNLYPVASPALYPAAQQRGLPVIQFLHNFRPFSVSGTVYARGQILAEALRGNYWREVRYGAWQDSVAKSALFAVMLKALHASGWLRSVRAWVAISDFMRERFIEAGIPADRIHTLRHFWQAMPVAPVAEDAGYYLYLARLVEVKGVEPLLSAWDALREQLGERTPPLHIGGEGPLAALVQRHAASNPSIRYLGLLSGEAKHTALRQCRALIIPRPGGSRSASSPTRPMTSPSPCSLRAPVASPRSCSTASPGVCTNPAMWTTSCATC